MSQTIDFTSLWLKIRQIRRNLYIAGYSHTEACVRKLIKLWVYYRQLSEATCLSRWGRWRALSRYLGRRTIPLSDCRCKWVDRVRNRRQPLVRLTWVWTSNGVSLTIGRAQSSNSSRWTWTSRKCRREIQRTSCRQISKSWTPILSSKTLKSRVTTCSWRPSWWTNYPPSSLRGSWEGLALPRQSWSSKSWCCLLFDSFCKSLAICIADRLFTETYALTLSRSMRLISTPVKFVYNSNQWVKPCSLIRRSPDSSTI